MARSVAEGLTQVACSRLRRRWHVAGALLAACIFALPVVPVAGAPSTSDVAQLIEPIRVRHGLPAMAAAVVIDGRVAACAATGVRMVGSGKAVTVHDQFHLGSCTKAMTATLLGIAVERGRLRFETTLAEALPDLRATMRPEYRSVTLEQILQHRAGLPADSWPHGMTFADVHRLPGPPRSQRQEYVRRVLAQEPDAPPGTCYIYSNAGYAVIGAAVERALNRDFESLLREWIFRQLGMKTAGFGAMGSPGKLDQPLQYRWEGGKLIAIPPGPMADNPSAIAPGGGVHCSIGDWARFLAIHAVGEWCGSAILRKETFRRLHQPLAGSEYAGGWVLTRRDWAGGRVLMHVGTNNQNYAVAWIAPERGFAVGVVANAPGDAAARACDEVAAVLIARFAPERSVGNR